MDLKRFDTRTRSESGIEVELLDLRTLKKSGVFIKVHGRDSQIYRDANTEMNRQIAEILEARGKVTDEEKEEMACEMLAACTIEWRGLESGGVEYVFDGPSKAKQLYRDYPAIREQVDRTIGNRANFINA